MTGSNPSGPTEDKKAYHRAYSKQHYIDNKAAYNKKSRLRNARVAKENKESIAVYLESHPCVDCGEDDIVVLQFDHTGTDKAANVTSLTRNSWIRIEAEIAKCDVVCANCHVRRTATRAGWYRVLRLP